MKRWFSSTFYLSLQGITKYLTSCPTEWYVNILALLEATIDKTLFNELYSGIEIKYHASSHNSEIADK